MIVARKGATSRTRFSKFMASMGPRLVERGKLGMRHHLGRLACGFNGAALGRARKGEPGSGTHERQKASMGPRLVTRKAAQCCTSAICRFNGAAPLSAESGSGSSSPLLAPASMGRSGRARKAIDDDHELRSPLLQWGASGRARKGRIHGWSSRVLLASMGPRLGRARKAALPGQVSRGGSASMGPRLVERGKGQSGSIAPSNIDGFNGSALG